MYSLYEGWQVFERMKLLCAAYDYEFVEMQFGFVGFLRLKSSVKE